MPLGSAIAWWASHTSATSLMTCAACRSAPNRVYHVRTEVLERLRPDLIVTQDQCQVCAVSLADVEQACSTLTHKPVRICSLTPQLHD